MFDNRTKPKTQGQIETAKTENQSEPKEKESSGPEDKEEEFATVKKKGRRGRRKHKLNHDNEEFKLRDNSEETLNRIMGIDNTCREIDLTYCMNESGPSTDKRYSAMSPDLSPARKMPDIKNYPEYLNPFNSDLDENDKRNSSSEKRTSSTVKVTVTELGDGLGNDSIHSSMTTLTDDSGGTSRSARRRRRRKQMKVQIGSLENVTVSVAQSVDSANVSTAQSLDSVNKGSCDSVESQLDVQDTNVSSETLTTETTGDDEASKPLNLLSCLSFRSSKPADDKAHTSGSLQNEFNKQGDSNVLSVTSTPPSIPGRKKKRKNKKKVKETTESKDIVGDSLESEEVSSKVENASEQEKDVSCGKLKNIFSRRKSKDEETNVNKDSKKPVEEAVIVPTKVVKEDRSTTIVPEKTQTNNKKKKSKKTHNEPIKRTDNFIQYADIVKNNDEIIQVTEIHSNQTLTNVDRANEILHLDDALLHQAVKTDFITMRAQKQDKNVNDRGKRWKCEDGVQIIEQIRPESYASSSKEPDNEVKTSITLSETEEQNQTEEDCKKIDDLFEQILMENEINDIVKKSLVQNSEENQALENATVVLECTTDSPAFKENIHVEESTKVERPHSLDTSGLKNITVTKSNNGQKDIVEIKPHHLMLDNLSCENNLITSTCYQENVITYENIAHENETKSRKKVVISEENNTSYGETIPENESVVNAEQEFGYFDDSEDEERTLADETVERNQNPDTSDADIADYNNLSPKNGDEHQSTTPEPMLKVNSDPSVSSVQVYNKPSPKRENTLTSDVVSFEEDEILQNLLNNLMLGEDSKRDRPIEIENNIDSTVVETSMEYDDANNVYIEEYIDDIHDRLDQKPYEEIIIKKEYNVRSMPETCYISVPGCRYLDVITEEASDISDGERNRIISAIEVSDIDDDDSSKDNDSFIVHNEMESQFTDYGNGGIDFSWQGKPLEEIDDVEIVYEEDESPLDVDQTENKIEMFIEPKTKAATRNTECDQHGLTPIDIYSKVNPTYVKEIKTVQIKDLEEPQRAHILETYSPKVDRKTLEKKKREAFFSENLDILNSNISLYGDENCLNQHNPDADLYNNYPDLIKVRNNNLEKSPEHLVQREFVKPECSGYNHTVESAKTEKINPVNELSPIQIDKCLDPPKDIDVTANYDIYVSMTGSKKEEDPDSINTNAGSKPSNEEEILNGTVAASVSKADDADVGDNYTFEVKTNQKCQRQTSSSSDTTQSTEKIHHDEVVFPGPKIKSLKEMAIDNLLIQPNGFETLLDIGIPIQEILEDLTGSNETLSFIETEKIQENYDRNEFLPNDKVHPILSVSTCEPKPPTPPPRRDSYIRMELGSDYTRNDFVPSSNILTPQSCPLSPRSSSSLSSLAYPINQINDQWMGLQSEDPQLIACISPSQSSSSKPMTPKEVSSLIDLHQKFVERRGYHESGETSSRSTPNSGRKTPKSPHKPIQLGDISRENVQKLQSKNRDSGDYTPELLQEAANLLSLKHYHDCRQRKMAHERSVTESNELSNLESKYPFKEEKHIEMSSTNAPTVDNITSPNNIVKNEDFTTCEASESDQSNTKTIKKTEMDNKFENESRPSKLLALIQEYKEQTSSVMECIPERERKDMHTSNVDEPLYSTNQSKFKSETINNTPNRNSSGQSERITRMIENNNSPASRIPTRNIIPPREFSEGTKLNNYQLEEKRGLQRGSDPTLLTGPNSMQTNSINKELTSDGIITNKSNTREYETINSSIQQEIDKLESFDFETLLKNFEDKNKPAEPGPVTSNSKPTNEEKEKNSVIVQYKISKKGDIAELNNNYDFEKQEIIKKDTSKVVVHINKITTKDNINIVEELQQDELQSLTNNDKKSSENMNRSIEDECSIPFATNDMGVQTVERREKKSKIPVKKSPTGLPVSPIAASQPKPASHHHKKCLQTPSNKVQKSKSVELQKSKSSNSNTQLESMYNEYMKEISAKKDRRKKRMIKLDEKATSLTNIKETINASDIYTTSIKVKNQLENEFMNKVKQRMNKYGINMKDYEVTNDYFSSDDDSERDVPKHLQEFIEISKTGTWSPATTPEVQRKSLEDSVKEVTDQNKRVDQSEAPAPIWTPKSAPSSPTAQRKFKPVNFKSPTLSRKAGNVSRNAENSTVTKPPTPRSLPVSPSPSQSNVIPPPTPPPSLSTPDSPVQSRSGPISRSSSSELTSTQTLSQTLHSSTSQKSQQSTSQHTSSSYSSSSIPRPSVSPHLPKSQNPTITLLQKAREGQLPKGASYLESNMPEQQQKDQNDNNIDSINETKSKPRKAAGVGPIIQEGVPTSLRSEVDEENKEKWYKKMYDSLHKFGSDQDYVTVRYKTKRKEDGHHGYSSEPEGVTGNKYATLDRRRVARSNKENEFVSAVNNVDNISYQNSIKHAMEIYKNQPGRIENYQPGHSSISEKEAKQWWDDMMDIFDEQMEQGKGRTIPTVVNSPTSRHPFMTYALKESGYESDSTLVFKKRDENQREHLSPTEQKIAYKVIQQGGEVPLHGLRKAAPEKPKDDTDIEYFPISPHLTRIRVHKNKKHLIPDPDLMREIICYPVTSIETHAPPPIFVNYKRTAPAAKYIPPTPPQRKSSQYNSTLRYINKLSISPTRASRNSPGIEVDSNVEYLKDRIIHKLDVSRPKSLSPKPISRVNSGTFRVKSLSPRKTATPVLKRQESIIRSSASSPVHQSSAQVHSSTMTRSAPTGTTSKLTSSVKVKSVSPSNVRSTLSLSPISKRTSSDLTSRSGTRSVSQPKPSTSRYSSPPIASSSRVSSSSPLYRVSRNESPSPGYRTKDGVRVTGPTLTSSIRSRRDQTQVFNSRLNKSPDLKSPNEVKKANILTEKQAKERILKGSKTVPPGTVVKSSTTYYTSTKNPKKAKEDKALRVTVAISAKGREILRASSVTGTAIDDRDDVKSNSTASTVNTKSTKLASEIENKKSMSSSKETLVSEPSKSTTSSKFSTSKKISNEDSNLKSPRKKSPARSSLASKPLAIIKTLSGKKVVTDVKKDGKESKKTKKVKSDSETASSSQKNGKKSKKLSKSKSETDDTDNVYEEIRKSEKAKPELIETKNPGPLLSDKFFQHLFLRDFSPSPSVSSSICRSSSVLEKAQKFQDLSEKPTSYKSEPSLGLLNVYLANKRPVSESKFCSLDRDNKEKSHRSPSPYLRYRRSEFLDKIDRFDRPNDVWSQSSSFSRVQSPVAANIKGRSSSEPPLSPLSTTEEPEDVQKETLSPSTRRIRNAQSSAKSEELSGSWKKGHRARSAGDNEPHDCVIDSVQPSHRSELNISDQYRDYHTYVLELMHSHKKSQRFKELHTFYSSLERMGELEKTTSNTDLRPRLKNEEIIDFDRWKQLRTKEKAEEELKVLYNKLKDDQKEKDLLFVTKDTDKWQRNKDRGLRNKEKSVEDLKQKFIDVPKEETMMEENKKRALDMKKDVYKPLWRGSSVVDLASSLKSTTASIRGRPVTEVDRTAGTIPRPSGSKCTKYIGNRLWSSLSRDQVNSLKQQLSEIYSTVSNLKRERINRMINKQKDCEIEITKDKPMPPGSESLHVRSSSFMTKDDTFTPVVKKKEAKRKEIMKSDSIGGISCWKTTSSSSASSPTNLLSESDKRKISMTLSKEVLEKVGRKNSFKKKKRSSSALVIPRETLGAVAAVKSTKRKTLPMKTTEPQSPRTCYSLDISEFENDIPDKNYLLVLGEKESDRKLMDDWSKKQITNGTTSTTTVVTETEGTSSSDASTVIHLGSREDVYNKQKEPKSTDKKKKSRRKEKEVTTKTKSIITFPEETSERRIENIAIQKSSTPSKRSIEAASASPTNTLQHAHSFTDLHELFGERKTYQNKETKKSSETVRARQVSSSYSRPSSQGYVSGDTIFRSRSVSPDPMRHYRTYLNVVKSGDVRKLRNLYESYEFLNEFCNNFEICSKRFQSDPEIIRNIIASESQVIRGQEYGDVQTLRRKFERRTRPKYRSLSPVLRHPFRAEQRYMPHINIISKLATLQRISSPERPRPPDPFRSGVVDTIKQVFERQDDNVSIMGQMYTSSPDIRELKHIAPYLECEWIAHKHPELASPRPKSVSPVRKHKSSILKTEYDPRVHQPLFRYVPKQEVVAYRGQYRTGWTTPLKPSVTFKDPAGPKVASVPVREYQSLSPGTLCPESPHKYVDSEVTLQYRRPVRNEIKELISEEELARRQAEAMRRIYQEERRRKYLQELHDISSRRHTDNFTPSQKSPIPLNRYDDYNYEDSSRPQSRTRDRTPEPKLVARALYNFVGQTSKELSFKKGDIIFVRRQVDKNWYEGEHNAMIGLFPFNYVEIIPYDKIRTAPKKLSEGQARAKFNFVAQTHLELSLVKGELVTLTRRVDNNWFEGRIGNRRGIFPVTYVEVLVEPGERAASPMSQGTLSSSSKPVAAPAAHSLIHNGAPSQHSYQPNSFTSVQQSRDSKSHVSSTPVGGGAPMDQTLHIDTHSDPVPYRALYSYKPQNDDELELREGETVFVMEKCDDGWYVGSSQRSGCFGTFPGNYVERAS
uniref:Sorbin and SH3 domain-containing protein 1 n=1 Tax=Cacopsylla melanoneura TaxID=428564 RepID=A0A8D8ZZP8_9HEMI